MNYNNLRFIGRHILKDGKEYFSYSGCGFEFAVYPSCRDSLIALSLSSETREYDSQYIAIFVNGEFIRKEKLNQGNNEIKIRKGDPLTLKKIQRLCTNDDATTLIKKAYDVGVGGIACALTEMIDNGVDLNLDYVPIKRKVDLNISLKNLKSTPRKTFFSF